jgi:perosamine synthetase
MIPVNEPRLGDKEAEYVLDCIRSGWISSAGKYIDRFEERWASYCGRRHGVAVANGTVALQIAVASLALPAGSEIIMPSFTIISCALAAVYNGCVPVLVDADPLTWGMDVAQIEAKITPRTRAIMPVHIYGHPVDMGPLLELTARRGIVVIEDAAEAHGAEYRGAGGWRRCGSFGELSCFSFYANKLITTGEGGMVLTDDAALAERARSLRNLCFVPGQRFRHEELGFNFRLTNVQAALGLAQIERMDAIVARKREIGASYSRQLKGLQGIQLPAAQEWARSVYWMYGLVVDERTGLDGKTLATRLLERKVETRPFFLGLHEQPALQKRGLFRGESYPVAERLARQGLYLPSGLALTVEQLASVCTAVEEALS